jgi:hypothetical protein
VTRHREDALSRKGVVQNCTRYVRLFSSTYMLLPLRLNAGDVQRHYAVILMDLGTLDSSESSGLETTPPGRIRRGRVIVVLRCPPPLLHAGPLVEVPRVLMGRCWSGPSSTSRGLDPVPVWYFSAHAGTSGTLCRSRHLVLCLQL